MDRQQQPALTAFALGLIGLGILALIYGDFALVWQPVPLSLPGRTAVAYLCGALMVSCGIGFFFRIASTWSARIVFPYLFLWLLLKVPALLVAPKLEAVWLNFGEIAVFFAAGWMLFVAFGKTPSSFLTGPAAVWAATALFGVSLIPIGLSHIFYTGQTVELIPVWMPFRQALAYVTGAGQILCGLAVLSGFIPRVPAGVPRVAALIEAAMASLFAALVWAPVLASPPTRRLPWTAFFITWFFAASAWVVSHNLRGQREAKQDAAAA